MIHVCFPLHDQSGLYSKYEGVAICSLLEKTREDISIHIICDKTLSSENKMRLHTLVEEHKQKIFFYEIEINNVFNKIKALEKFTIGTLFRLKIADVLPTNIDKVIYLDADIIVDLDIKELWDVNIDKYMIAAKQYAENNYFLCKQNIVGKNKYFNAGVLVLNLSGIRSRHDLFEESIRFFSKYPECEFADNDALNFIFYDEVLYLDEKYNVFTSSLRKDKRIFSQCIYHFAGDYINYIEMEEFDILFIKYLFKTPWGSNQHVFAWVVEKLKMKEEQITIYQKLLQCGKEKKKIIFGASGILRGKILSNFSFTHDFDYCVDNNNQKIGCVIGGLKVYHPKKILEEKINMFIVIIVSKEYCKEIRNQLLDYGLNNEQIFDGIKLLTESQGGYRVN